MNDKCILTEKYAYRLGTMLGFWKEHTFKVSNNRRYDILKDYLNRFYADVIAVEYDSQTQ